MNKIKLEYEQPSCNLLVVRFEQGILYVSGGRNVANIDGGVSGTDQYDDSYGDL